MTPAQLQRHYDGAAERRKLELANGVIVAFYGAQFERAKTMPSLPQVIDRIMTGGKSDNARMTWQEMRDNLRGWKKLVAKTP